MLALAMVTACGGGGNTGGENAGADANAAADGGGEDTTPATPAGPVSGGVLRLTATAEGAAPMGVPWENTTNDTLYIVPMVESLVLERSDGTIEPFLGESWNVDMDAKEVTFKLKEGVKFTDGSDFNAEVAVWNLTNCIEAGQLVGATSAEVRGDYEIAIKFDTYQNQMLSRLAARTCGFVSKESFDANGIEWARENPVYTGPFVMKEFVRGEKMELVRNENYWGENMPYLDGVTFLFIRDVMTQQAAMQSEGDQSLDLLGTTSGETAKTFQDLGFVVDKMSIGPLVLVPSSKDKNSPLANADVRKAIAWAIDRQAISDARGFGIMTPAFQMISADWGAHLPSSEDIGYDVAKAKQFLADAGYPDGFKTKIILMPGFADRDAMVIVQNQLAEIGIEVELELPDSGGYNNYRSTGWDGLLAQHFRVAPNVNNMWNVYLPPEEISLVSLARDPATMEALKVSSATPEVDDAAAQAVVRAMHESMMMIPVYDIYDITISKDYVKDTGFCQWGSSTVWLARQAYLAQD
jgi:peptide/nickel transport system substrate-binding protein